MCACVCEHACVYMYVYAYRDCNAVTVNTGGGVQLSCIYTRSSHTCRKKYIQTAYLCVHECQFDPNIKFLCLNTNTKYY